MISNNPTFKQFQTKLIDCLHHQLGFVSSIYLHKGFPVLTWVAILLFPAQCLSAQKAPGNNRFDPIEIRKDHPRIWVDADKLTQLKQKFKGKNADQIQEIAGPSVIGLALTYLVSGDATYGQKAIDKVIGTRVDSGSVFYDLDTKEGRSKTSSIQANLADIAICYDWCFPLLKKEEKESLTEEMLADMKKRISFKRSWRSFHNSMYASAWPVTAATLALYHEDPYAKSSWEFLKPELEDAMRTFDNVFPDGEWAEGFDYNRHSTYHALRIFLAIKSATGFDVISDSPHMKNTGQYILYSFKPNGLALPSDDNDWPYIGDWEHVALLMLNETFKDGFNQYFINHCPFERFKLEPDKKYANALWYNPAIPEKPLSKLPLNRLFQGKGLLIGRSAWDWDEADKKSKATWFTFHCGDYLGDHVHNDINNLEIYHQGSLAIDAGRYDDDWTAVIENPDAITKSQFFNYYRRSIAHNTVLVYDPNEEMSQQIINDGGQKDLLRPNGKFSPRNVPEDYDQGNFPSDDGIGTCDWVNRGDRWETGNILAYQSTPEFTYISGDGAKAYHENKVDQFVRQVVFVQPDVFIVFDKVVSDDASFKKTWLLHAIEEPKINKNNIQIEHQQGRLTNFTLLPKSASTQIIGGIGNECMVDSVSFKFGLNSHYDPTALHYGEEAGAWRVELSPQKASKEDFFLNVMHVSGKKDKANLKVELVNEDSDYVTVKLTTKGKNIFVTLSKSNGPGTLEFKKGNKSIFKSTLKHEVILEEGKF
ncbi:MAG TPA: DUF4962 domain-containing protein [Saprospiraceae bacterium]|nr:DUF4962 domain-containing protein [Saprospiraceae bacterium]HPN67877.1 DUF4962 domain-containing protein [Saprospiraceae bacterium]